MGDGLRGEGAAPILGPGEEEERRGEESLRPFFIASDSNVCLLSSMIIHACGVDIGHLYSTVIPLFESTCARHIL